MKRIVTWRKAIQGLLLVSWIFTGSGCRKSSGETTAETNQAGAEVLPASARIFPTRGVLRSMGEGRKTVVIRHEEIPGYMQAMTMELTPRDPKELDGIKVGDTLEFELVALEDRHWIQGLKRVAERQTATAPIPMPLVATRPILLLKPGEAFPEVQLRDEEGHDVGFADFRGRAIAMTFFFTRCPLPDFCPRMLKNFGKARNQLITNSEGRTNWHFLSISFDSAVDTPEVLKRHATGYRGSEVAHWTFCSADTNAMSVLIPATHLVIAREGESFSHNLRTVVLDTRGRLFKRLDGNEWTPEELADSLREASKVPY